MIKYSTVGTNSVAHSREFYKAVLRPLGLVSVYETEHETMFAPKDAEIERSVFCVTLPFDGKAARPGNGTMTAFQANNIEMVKAVHAAALRAGGQCEGAPGPREYNDHMYIAYFRDLDYNKLAVVYFSSAPLAAYGSTD